MWMDPPEHTAARAAITTLFTHRMTAARADFVTTIVAARYARFVGAGGGDAVTGFALPMTTELVAEVAGLTADAATLRTWSTAASALMAKPHHLGTVSAAAEALIALGRQTCGPPAESENTVVGRAGHMPYGVSGRSALHLASLFAFAGIETTSQAVARMLDLCAVGTLRLSDLVVDELLRYDTPVPQVPRVALRDTTVGAHQIRSGQAVLIILAAANRDARRFPDPGVACPRKDAGRHLAYGHGRHRCVGASLDHQILAAVADEIGRHPLPLHASPPQWHSNRGYRGIERLELIYPQGRS
jgi:cytochrome P450